MRPATSWLVSFPRIAGVSALMAASMLAANLAFADPAKATVNIPPQGLSSALKALASQTNSQLLFATDALQGERTEGVSGSYMPEEALKRLLKGTHFTYRMTDSNTFTVQSDGEKKSEAAAAARKSALLPEVVVTATKTEREITDVPASVSVIDARDIARQQPRKTEELLKQVEGVDVNASPATGGAGMIILRGVGGSFAGQTTQVLVDGMATDSVVSAINGRGGLNFLAAQDIERIEVVRGPASALYGPSAVGGVINVLPKRWSGPAGAEVVANAGSHNSQTLGAAMGTANDTVDFRLSVSDFRTDGYIAQPNPDSGGSKDLAARDWTDSKAGFQAGIHPSANQELTVSALSYRTNSAQLGGHPNDRLNNDGETMTLGYRHELNDRATFKVFYRKSRVKALGLYDDEVYNGNMGSLILASTNERVSDSDSLEGQADLRLSSNNLLTLGLSHDTGEHKATNTDVLANTTRVDITKSEMTGFFVQDEHRFSDAWTLIAGGRFDRISLFGDSRNGVPRYKDSTETVFNPRAGLRYHLSPATSFYASAGTAYVPALNYLKFISGGTWLENPDLKPESSTSYEIGLNQRLGWASLRAAVFHTDYRDKISSVRVSSAPVRNQYQNIGKVTVDGLEIGLEGKLPGGWQPYVNYAYTDSKIKENPTDPLTVGKEVQRVAPHKLNLGVVYTPNKTWDARVGGRYVSERFFTDRNTPDHRAPGYFVADAKASAKLPVSSGIGQWEAFAAINNLFDKRYTEWEYEFADERNFWLGVNGKF
ncbi:MAG TPA: TonB-dependent receptor [Sulfuricella sp.]|nr:TonB-dependent receptor [Sulfuricella sp.]